MILLVGLRIFILTRRLRVHNKNQQTFVALESDPRFSENKKLAREIILAGDCIPKPFLSNGYVFNFWQDHEHVQGIWRKTPLEEYRKDHPLWETLLDLDQLSKTEGKTWVWKGADCFPRGSRCLIKLSPGGTDASVIREFDLDKREFVKDGFQLPEAKSRMSWRVENSVWVGTESGEGSLTRSGYSRLVKIWKRGQPFE